MCHANSFYNARVLVFIVQLAFDISILAAVREMPSEVEGQHVAEILIIRGVSGGDIMVEQFRAGSQRVVLQTMLPIEGNVHVAEFIGRREVIGSALVAFVFALQPAIAVVGISLEREFT